MDGRVGPVASRLRALIEERGLASSTRSALFVNRDGRPLTRFGVQYILDVHARRGAEQCPSIADKNVHPHVLRHTTAMHLLQSGVDLNTIRCWLGHASVTTTNRYVEADLEMKRRALGTVPSPPGAAARSAVPDEGLLGWLEGL